MNTRKDFWRAVEIIRGNTSDETPARAALVHAFVEFFKEDNARFDSDRFRSACDGNESRRSM